MRFLLSGQPGKSQPLPTSALLTFSSANAQFVPLIQELCDALTDVDIPRSMHAIAQVILFAGRVLLVRIASLALEKFVSGFFFAWNQLTVHGM
jgi:hypothetical protein